MTEPDRTPPPHLSRPVWPEATLDHRAWRVAGGGWSSASKPRAQPARGPQTLASVRGLSPGRAPPRCGRPRGERKGARPPGHIKGHFPWCSGLICISPMSLSRQEVKAPSPRPSPAGPVPLPSARESLALAGGRGRPGVGGADLVPQPVPSVVGLWPLLRGLRRLFLPLFQPEGFWGSSSLGGDLPGLGPRASGPVLPWLRWSPSS